RHAARCEPSPWHPGTQGPFQRREVQRGRQRLRLAHVAGIAVAEDPGLLERRSFHHCDRMLRICRRNPVVDTLHCGLAMDTGRYMPDTTTLEQPALEQPALEQLFLKARTY